MRMPAALVVVLALALSACGSPVASPSPSPTPRLEELAIEQLGTLDGVSTVNAEVHDGALELGVVMEVEVTSAQLVAAAVAVREFTLEHADVSGTHAGVSIVASDNDGDTDTPPVAPLSLELYPSLRTTPSEDARQLFAAHRIPGVTRVAISSNSVSVDVGPASDLGPALDGLRQLDLWSNGGAVWAELGRVRIMDVPNRLTNDGMRVILGSAVAYPAAQFWLEAARTGEQWPRLYVDNATQEEAMAIASSLGDPTMPEPTVDDLEVSFVVSWVDSEGRHDLTGLLGVRWDQAP
jgi:hypothetical protein